MVVERNGVRLIRLTEECIELVRQKRNSPEIQSTMEYREHITPEMQRVWFNSIDNIYNYYFLIETKGKLIGLISATNIDWEHGIINNGGVFIWDKNYWESQEIMIASLLITDTGLCMGIKENYIKILQDNKRSIAYNKAMGYELLPNQEHILNQRYLLMPDRYFRMTEKVRRLLKTEQEITIGVNQEEYYYHELEKRMAYANRIDLNGIKVNLIVSQC